MFQHPSTSLIRALIFALPCCLLPLSQVSGATITYVGTDNGNVGANWSTSSVSKPYDIDGDGIYGTDGFYLFQSFPGTANNTSSNPFANVDVSSPFYGTLSAATLGANGSAGNTSFALIDDWQTPEGPDLNSGYAYRTGVTANTETVLFEFTLNNLVESANTYYIGILYDNTIAGDQPISLRLAGASGNSGSISLAAANNTIDYSFFSVTGLNDGDILTIYATRGAGLGNVGIGGVFFDYSTIPEPSTYALIFASLLLLVLVRWKRRPATEA